MKEFEVWFNDNNVVKFIGGYGTQDAQYKNRLKSKKELFNYFKKEFRS